MFEDPGASFFGMAFETYIDVEFVPPPEARPGAGTVGRVAIRTGHRPLEDLMVGRKEEFEPDLPVTGKTQVDLFVLEKLRERGRPVNAMAIVATHRAQLMGGPLELEKLLLFLVASQAGIRPRFGFLASEGENKVLVSAGVYVFFAGSVARFAAHPIWGCFRVVEGNSMRIFSLKFFIETGMTKPAGLGN